MNELTRLIYLQAMGTETYVSRWQLPGAADTRRLAIVRRPIPPQVPGISGLADLSARQPGSPRSEIPRPARPETVPASSRATKNPAPRFSLVAVSCGGWMWLEELEDALWLPEQLLLIQSIAGALGILPGEAATRITSTQFDWPIHKNRQLDQGEEAARSSVTGFIERKLNELHCRGLVLMGAGCERRIAQEQLDHTQIVRTASTAEILRKPLIKRQVWRDLQPLFQRA